MINNYSEQYLKTTLVKETIAQTVYYYSVGKKDQKSFSIMSNDRLLVFDFDNGKIFYTNQVRGLPFRERIPMPKNITLDLITTSVSHQPQSKELQFGFQYQNEPQSWKFQFQTVQVVEKWIQIFQFQRKSQKTQQKDVKAINKSIVEIAKIEQQNVQDIVKEQQRDLPVDESRVIQQMAGLSKSRVSVQPQSRIRTQPQLEIKPQNKKGVTNDWNERFYQWRNISTLFTFKEMASDTFFSKWKDDDIRKGGVRQYQTKDCTIKIANRFSVEAKRLKNQYRNYHFILEATNKEWIVGVPLACLIQFECVVGLVKAKFPERVQKIPYQTIVKEHFNQLQRYTRIKNKCLENATIYNLSQFYNSSLPSLIYVDDLGHYLPVNFQFTTQQTLIRPQHILDSVDYYIYTNYSDRLNKNDFRQLKELSYSILQKVKIFSYNFYRLSFPVVKISQLKNIIHSSGLNMKFLPHIYSHCNNQQIKRYVYSAMTAKIVKDYFNQSIMKIRQNDNKGIQPILEQTLGWLLSGGNNKSHQFWKEVALMFKKKFNIILNQKDLIPGFFLNSLLELIPATYDLTKLNKHKRIFQTTRVFEQGFVKLLQPKIKCFDRFLPARLEDLKNEAKYSKYSKQMCEEIRSQLLSGQGENSSSYYSFGNNDEWMVQYLSMYYPPEKVASQSDDRIENLFARINEEPPSHFTMTLTNNYLQWCNKRSNQEQFNRVFKVAMQIADYWLDQIHPLRSDLLQILSDFYSIIGINEDMIKFMRDSLNLAIKFWGGGTEQVSIKQYQLADRYLRAGYKKQAVELFLKAKQTMTHNKTKTNKLGLINIKLAAVYLSDLQYEKASRHAKDSITVFEDYQRKIKIKGIYHEPYKIKAYELLSRVYEICDQRTEYKDLALTCARKFNQTQNDQVYQQMIRIVLAAAIFKSTVERSQSFEILVENISNSNRQNQQSQRLTPINQLKKMSEDIVVMQKFMGKYQFIDRSFFDNKSRKSANLSQDNKQFMHILKNIIEVVGADYIKGLIEEKACCG